MTAMTKNILDELRDSQGLRLALAPMLRRVPIVPDPEPHTILLNTNGILKVGQYVMFVEKWGTLAIIAPPRLLTRIFK